MCEQEINIDLGRCCMLSGKIGRAKRCLFFVEDGELAGGLELLRCPWTRCARKCVRVVAGLPLP